MTSQQHRQIKPSLIASLIYNLLLKSHRLQDSRLSARLWRLAWEKAQVLFGGPVVTRIHDTRVIVNFGYTYPLFARRFPSYNQPLVELVYRVFAHDKAPIYIADVGAATGDTVLLVDKNCPGMVGRYLCIDGDPEFFAYLEHNLQHKDNVTVVFALLSSEVGTERTLVRMHAGTASAQGTATVPSTTLDTLLERIRFPRLDLLKIDTEGFDGRVLRGAEGILGRDKPAVIFEWHPILCRQTDNSWLEHFEILLKLGYHTYLWFTKFGTFSHFTVGLDTAAIRFLADLCIRGHHAYDWHYDVIALHDSRGMFPLDLAELSYARSRVSRW